MSGENRRQRFPTGSCEPRLIAVTEFHRRRFHNTQDCPHQPLLAAMTGSAPDWGSTFCATKLVLGNGSIVRSGHRCHLQHDNVVG